MVMNPEYGIQLAQLMHRCLTGTVEYDYTAVSESVERLFIAKSFREYANFEELMENI